MSLDVVYLLLRSVESVREESINSMTAPPRTQVQLSSGSAGRIGDEDAIKIACYETRGMAGSCKGGTS